MSVMVASTRYTVHMERVTPFQLSQYGLSELDEYHTDLYRLTLLPEFGSRTSGKASSLDGSSRKKETSPQCLFNPLEK